MKQGKNVTSKKTWIKPEVNSLEVQGGSSPITTEMTNGTQS